MKNIIEVKNFVKKYGAKIAVDKISFSVKEGEIFGILGPNGAGKTSTLEVIETLRQPSAGEAAADGLEIDDDEIILDGINVAKFPRKIKNIIGIQLQNSAFYDKLTLVEQLKLFASFYGAKIDAAELLKKVDLAEKAKEFPEKLSGGQKQRFAIAVALVNKPRILFLDEPTTGLDPQARRNMWDLISQIRKSGITVVMTTHYMEEAQKLCDRVAILDAGKIIALDTPENLIRELLTRGFHKKRLRENADLEDVYIDLTGKDLRE